MRRAGGLLLVAGLLCAAPAHAAGTVAAATPREARDVFECLKERWLTEWPSSDWLTVDLAAAPNPPDMKPPTVFDLDIGIGKRFELIRPERPLRCGRRTAPPLASAFGSSVHEPNGHRDTLGSRYRFTDCRASWPIRRGDRLAVDVSCIETRHAPLGMHAGRACGGDMHNGEVPQHTVFFRRLGGAWVETGEIESGHYSFYVTGRGPCPAAPPAAP